MKRTLPLLLSALVVAGCQPMLESTDRINTGLRENYVTTSNRMSEWFYVDPNQTEPQPVRQDVEPVYNADRDSSYCYKTASGPICYGEPLLGQESRLVGFQSPAYSPEVVIQRNTYVAGPEAVIAADNLAPLPPKAPLAAEQPATTQPIPLMQVPR